MPHEERSPLNRKLSVLELTTLGQIWKSGAMTAYSLMRGYSESGAGYYRSGAGSVYPMVKRLAKAGYLKPEEGSGKAERLYTVTEQGQAALREWMTPPFDSEEFTCALDLFRSRSYLLTLLSPEARSAFFEAVTQGLEVLHARCEEIVASAQVDGDEVDALAATGALYETEARLRWIRMMREKLP